MGWEIWCYTNISHQYFHISLWFQVYYSIPKPHAFFLSLLLNSDENKQVSAHLCITTVRCMNTPTHSTKSSKTTITVKRSVFTKIFLCLLPLAFPIGGKIFKVFRSLLSPCFQHEIPPHSAEYLREECPENHSSSCTTNPVLNAHFSTSEDVLSPCISAVTFQKVWRKLVGGSEEEF